ncbi:uncharacterized protein LOC26526893 [Drosophila erecta]|uniref:MARVEL domain-containing protein n=1 Tax=Drosophila erecta TaxID=7220 RepID=A0A0Q5UJS1_DROER|nr:uncharacterized protein LOC26526893 [Drosophila erecta]KQS44278.1 uncharacterized protein Dere_GG27069 [Drosophila erecta]
MWRAEKFCFCMKLRIGCTIIAFLTLFLCAAHLVEFFRLKDPYSPGQTSDWFNLLWGIFHMLASLCLSYSLLLWSPLPIWSYIIIEAVYLISIIIYTSVTCALKTNTYVSFGLTYSILYWIIIICICVITTYFLWIVISCYFLIRQRRQEA